MIKVLFIEPDAALARTYSQALMHEGYKTAAVRGAEEALEEVEHFAPDLIVLELQLPRHSGVAFLHEFRSYSEWQNTPVLISTHLPPQFIDGIKNTLSTDLGVSAILYKPQTSLKGLIRSIGEHCGQIV